MNGIMNETRFSYCDISDKTNKSKSKSKHIISKTRKHKQKNGTVVKNNEVINPGIDEVNYILNDTFEDCRKNFFTGLNIDVYMLSILKFLRVSKKLL